MSNHQITSTNHSSRCLHSLNAYISLDYNIHTLALVSSHKKCCSENESTTIQIFVFSGLCAVPLFPPLLQNRKKERFVTMLQLHGGTLPVDFIVYCPSTALKFMGEILVLPKQLDSV